MLARGNFQNVKNNIDGKGYQGVAEQYAEVSANRDSRLRKAFLGLGSDDQRVHALAQPTEIKHARTAPIIRPVAHGKLCTVAAAAPARAPVNKVNQAMRCSVFAALVRITVRATTLLPGVTGSSADDLANPAKKSQRPEDKHQPRLGVQPAVEVEAEKSAE